MAYTPGEVDSRRPRTYILHCECEDFHMLVHRDTGLGRRSIALKTGTAGCPLVLRPHGEGKRGTGARGVWHSDGHGATRGTEHAPRVVGQEG